MLGVTYKTAWFMCHRLREAMRDDGSPLGGPGKVVESDEAFVGGKKKKRLSGKVAPMKKVMTLVERDGRARCVPRMNHTPKKVTIKPTSTRPASAVKLSDHLQMIATHAIAIMAAT
jgi:hypothetical protein